MPLYAGFDVGGTAVKYGLIDGRGRVVFKNEVSSPRSGRDLLALFASLWPSLKKTGRTRILAAGLGFPGIFHLNEQKILQSPNFPALDGFPLRSGLAGIFDVPFWIDNDANFAAYGEFRRGAGKGVKNLVLLTLGTGIGSGIILDGEMVHGACGFAAEMGHLVVNPNGERCACGSRGCLETEASAVAIVRHYRRSSGSKERLTVKDVAARAKRGDRAARRSFARAALYLGIGLGSAINLLNPEKILLGGGVMGSSELILPGAIREARRRCYAASFACCSIEKAGLGNDAGFIGAASWAGDRLRSGR